MMHRKWIFLFVLILTALLLGSTRVPAAASSPAYGFDVSVTPDPHVAGAFLAKFIVTNLSTGQTLAAPSIRTRSGEQAEATSQNGAERVRCTLVVSQDATSAEYKAEILDGDTVTGRSQAKVSLSR